MPLTDINNAMICDQGKAGAGILLSSAAFRQCQEAAAVLHLKGQHLEVILFFSTLPETEEFRTTWIVPRIREPVALVSLSLYLL